MQKDTWQHVRYDGTPGSAGHLVQTLRRTEGVANILTTRPIYLQLPRQSTITQVRCIKNVKCDIEGLFAYVASKYEDEEDVDAFFLRLNMTMECQVCGRCKTCLQIVEYAEAYGQYEIMDRLRACTMPDAECRMQNS